MSAFIQRTLSALVGLGDEKLLPPSEFISQDDCSSCQDPCTEHKEYPPYLSINKDIPILGSVKTYGRHILISTGVSDWQRDIEDDTDSFTAHLGRVIKNNKQEWKTMITNTNGLSSFSTIPNSCDVLIFPDNILVSNVTPEKAQRFHDIFVNVPLPESPVCLEEISKNQKMGDMEVFVSPYQNLLLLCSHQKRDKRCGVTAPILAQEIDHVLREKELDEYDVGILMVSHIGGHKFAGNVICYTRKGTRGIWYGRVKTCHVKKIIEETVLQGKIITELYRGAMNGTFDNKISNNLQW